jgi:DNA-directed RNA polymerase specialized sigma24 family protein
MDRVSGVECGRREAPALSLTPDRLKVLQTTAHHHAHRVAARGLDGGTDVADVRQALVLAAWSRIAQFDPRRASWSTFVNLVVRHAAWDLAARFREQRAIATSSLDGDHPACADGGSDQHELVADPQSVGDDSSNPFIAVELGVDVERAVESLPDPLRRLCRLLQLEPPSVAQRLSGLSPADFYRQVHEVRMRFRSLGLRPGSTS